MSECACLTGNILHTSHFYAAADMTFTMIDYRSCKFLFLLEKGLKHTKNTSFLGRLASRVSLRKLKKKNNIKTNFLTRL